MHIYTGTISTRVQEDLVTSDTGVVKNATSSTCAQEDPVTRDTCVVRNAASNTDEVIGMLIE